MQSAGLLQAIFILLFVISIDSHDTSMLQSCDLPSFPTHLVLHQCPRSKIKATNVESIYHYVASRSYYEMLQEFDYSTIATALVDFLRAFGTSGYHFIRFVAYLLCPLVLVSLMTIDLVLPHLLDQILNLGLYLSQQSPLFLAKLTLSIVASILSYRQMKKTTPWIRKEYTNFTKQLTAKSQRAAQAFPHVLFFMLVIGIKWLVPYQLVDFVANETSFTLIVLWIPVYRSIQLLLKLEPLRSTKAAEEDDGPKSKKKKKKETPPPSSTASRIPVEDQLALERQTQYWILYSCYLTIISIGSCYVFSSVIVYLTLPYYYRVAFMLWMDYRWTNGLVVVYNFTIPYLSSQATVHLARTGIELQEHTQDRQQSNRLVQMLSALFFRDQVAEFMVDMWNQGPAIAGLLFVFTPSFITYQGSYLIGMVLPGYFTIQALAKPDLRNLEWWLSYFSVFATLEYVVDYLGRDIVGWIPLYQQLRLLWILWLQFPYFRGARTLLCPVLQTFSKKPDGTS